MKTWLIAIALVACAHAVIHCEDDVCDGGWFPFNVTIVSTGSIVVRNCTFYGVSFWCIGCSMNVTDSTFVGGAIPIIGHVSDHAQEEHLLVVQGCEFLDVPRQQCHSHSPEAHLPPMAKLLEASSVIYVDSLQKDDLNISGNALYDEDLLECPHFFIRVGNVTS